MKHSLLQFFILLLATNLFSQKNEESSFYHRSGELNPIGAGTLSTGNSGTGANIDVLYHRCNWTANPDDATKTLKGNVVTYFKTISAGVNSISFDFNNTSFNNDSLVVLYHNTACVASFSTTGNQDVLNITLPTTLALSAVDSVTIKYEGIPPAESGNALGYQRATDAASNNYIYTLSESYEDKDWWPCKADMKDKIDSLDINVTVPNGFWVAANGLMIDSAISGSNRVFKFKHRYPIASYLVAIAIAKYKKYNLGNLVVAGKNVPFVLNIFSGKSSPVETSILNYMNNHKLVFAALNNLFGDYPYSNEKHGFYEFGFSGGMEHQTFSGIGTSSLQSNSILAHELGHQWFGDKVTFATWNHLWLAEGFATYSEVLAAEFVPSLGINYVNKMANNKASARNYTSHSTYINSISNSDAVWSNSNTVAVYNRGCMVVSMLRALLGDAKFFAACKNYLSDTAIAYKAATSADLQRNMENQFGESMSNFFAEWVNKKGIPNYAVEWGNVGKTINIKLAQTVTASGASGTAATFFPMPVVIKISDGTTDTTVVIYHKAANQTMYAGNGIGAVVNSNTISFNLSFTPTTVTFDPENKTMALATVSYSALLPISNATITGAKQLNKNKMIAHIATNETVEKVELQKSIDGLIFSNVGLMKKITNTNSSLNYELYDDDFAVNKIYYRAKIYLEGKQLFSNIFVLDGKSSNNNVIIIPNPANNFAKIFFDNPSLALMTVQLSDIAGKKIQTQNTTTNCVLFETSKLHSGTYMISLYKNNFRVGVEKLVIYK